MIRQTRPGRDPYAGFMKGFKAPARKWDQAALGRAARRTVQVGRSATASTSS